MPINLYDQFGKTGVKSQKRVARLRDQQPRVIIANEKLFCSVKLVSKIKKITSINKFVLSNYAFCD